MTQSLHSFCKFHGLSKGSVHAYLKDQGFSLSQGMNTEAIAAAREHFIGKAPSTDDTPESPTYPMGPAGYADPFAGMTLGASGSMVPTGFQAQNRSLATSAAAQRVQDICIGANLHTQQTVAAALESGDQMGQQLGAFWLAERTIAAAETQRQQLIAEYFEKSGG
jgi:hypothetical protein